MTSAALQVAEVPATRLCAGMEKGSLGSAKERKGASDAVLGSTVAAPRVPGRRAEGVSWVQRTANTLFGAPSARRANGGAAASFVPRVLRGPRWRSRCEATTVFAVDRKGGETSERLPRIWVSEPAQGEGACGRTFVASYPNGPDRGGWRAFDLAERYFAEALSLVGEQHRARRVDCYRAAEILLLHAACRGHVAAHCRLGIIYEADLCEGVYWQGLLEGRALHSAETPCDERAYLHFSYAAFHGYGEACWRLGDMVAAGRGGKPAGAKPADSGAKAADPGATGVLAATGGTAPAPAGETAPAPAGETALAPASAPNYERALALYRRAFDLDRDVFDEDRASTGNAALRMARAFELGRGCKQSFRRARTWYRVAACALGAAFDQGQWFYKRERAEARRGIARMAQELDGRY